MNDDQEKVQPIIIDLDAAGMVQAGFDVDDDLALLALLGAPDDRIKVVSEDRFSKNQLFEEIDDNWRNRGAPAFPLL